MRRAETRPTAIELRPIPKGWAWSTLMEIGQKFRPIIYGIIKPGPHVPDGIPYVRVTEMKDGWVDVANLKRTSVERAARFARATLAPGDVLISKDGTIGRVAVVPPELAGGNITQHVMRVPLHPGVHRDFVVWAIRSDGCQKWLTGETRGVALRGVNVEDFRRLPVPIAPINEQQRIVAALDERLSELDASVASLERAERNLVRYRAAVLAAACSGKLVPTEADLARRTGRSYEPANQLLARILAERRKASTKAKYEEPSQPDTSKLPKLPEGWVWASLESLPAQEKNSVTDGPFGSKLKTEHYTASGPRVIRLQNIGDGQFIDAYSHISKEHFFSLTKHHVFPADVVIGALGERPPRSCIIPNGIGPALVKADCIRFKPHPEMMTPEFLNYALNSSLLKSQGEAIVHGVGRPRLNLGEILSLAVPLPPLAEQSRIVAEVDRHLSRADALAASIAQSKRRAQRLRRAILAAAFQGRLVPQDPNDEPASVLLDRIRAQAATAEATTAAVPRRGRPSAPPAAPVASASPPAMTPKRRGRPPGSKNRPKA